MKHRMAAPIRTRGDIRRPGAERPHVPAESRSKAFRTRGSAPAAPASLLGDVLSNIRAQVGGFPLTIVIHGWRAKASRGFLGELTSYLKPEDAVWLVSKGVGPQATEPVETPEHTVLDLDNEVDAGSCNNLLGDVVFFPGQNARETSSVALWSNRARVLITPSDSPHCGSILRASSDADISAYSWLGGMNLEASGKRDATG